MTRPAKVCAQDFFFGTAFARERLLTPQSWLVARRALPGSDLCFSPSLTDCIGRVHRLRLCVFIVVIFMTDMRYEKAARRPIFFNNELVPSCCSCGLLWSAHVRYGSVFRSGLRRPCARAAAPYRHTRMRLSAACALSACRPARSQMHAKSQTWLHAPPPPRTKIFFVGKGAGPMEPGAGRRPPPLG